MTRIWRFRQSWGSYVIRNNFDVFWFSQLWYCKTQSKLTRTYNFFILKPFANISSTLSHWSFFSGAPFVGISILLRFHNDALHHKTTYDRKQHNYAYSRDLLSAIFNSPKSVAVGTFPPIFLWIRLISSTLSDYPTARHARRACPRLERGEAGIQCHECHGWWV